MPDQPPSPPEPPAQPLPASADESKRFPADPFGGVKIPERYHRDGKPDLNAFVAGFEELERGYKTKTEDLKAQIAAETLKERPAAAAEYKIPKIKGIDEAELAGNPMVEWWREQAFEVGLPQKKFEKAIETYIEKMQPVPVPEETLKAELGESFKARIAAVDAWATKTAKDPAEMAALQEVATSPAGIRLLERLAGLGGGLRADDRSTIEPDLTLDKLRAMQADPRYWDSTRRDPDFVHSVEEGYKKLYPSAKAS